jgi:hypothetical protein
MYNQQKLISGLIFFMFFSVILNSQTGAQPSNKTYAPLLGWNSYNSYGSSADAKILSENLDVFKTLWLRIFRH